MKRIYLFLSILLCSLTMSAQSAWIFNHGDSLSWQPTQDMTITFEKDPAGFFWQNIQTGNLDVVRMPINTGDSIKFADAPFLQVEKDYYEVTNTDNRRLEIKLKTNISDGASITCQLQADWLRLVDTNDSQPQVITYTFEYDANYIGSDRSVSVVFKNEQYDLSNTVKIVSLGEWPATERDALMNLYYATDGDHWTNNTNWGSDKPLSEWYGVYVSGADYVYGISLGNNNLSGQIPETISRLSNLDYIYLPGNKLSGEIPHSLAGIRSLQNIGLERNALTGEIPEEICKLPLLCSLGLEENKLSGCFPASLTLVMSKVRDLAHMSLKGNYFTGKIPDEIVNHRRFKEMWPEFLNQHTELDLSNVVLYAPDFRLVDIDGNIIKSSEIYKNNKLTLLYEWESWCPYSLAFNEKLIPAYHQFHEKGFDVLGLSVLCDLAIPCDDEETYRTYINEKSVPWHNVSQTHENYIPLLFYCATPSTVLVDQDGKIISHSLAQGGEDYNQIIPRLEEFFAGTINNEYYTSTDYSKDGEVQQLQIATEGKGIDLVFMGEAFVDKDMDNGGKYEKKMQNAMEQFFSEEPYKSLRSRFNVFVVKVVSPNAEFASDARHAINEDNEKAFEYAKKALGEDAKRLMVGVVYNTDYGIDRSITTMYESDNSFVAYMMDGVSKVLNHEMGGHGLAFLLDEYVELGMEEQSPNDEIKAALDAFYIDYGEGANVDWRSDPTKVRWAHFLCDSRYADEGLGVYEGARYYGHGMYRPTENSMMRYNDCGFNAPSREAIYKRIMKLSEGNSWTYDYETFVSFDTPARDVYKQARSRVQGIGNQNDHKQRIESRPPIIYKGTWHDAGKCKKIKLAGNR